MNKDELKGKAKDLKGRAKEGAGEMIDDERLEHEGKAEQLEGQTQDVAELHAYVAQVGGSPLFTSAQIMSLEVAPGDKQPAQNNFRLRAIVRPGYAASSGAPASQSKPQQVTGAGLGGAAPRMARGGSER